MHQLRSSGQTHKIQTYIPNYFFRGRALPGIAPLSRHLPPLGSSLPPETHNQAVISKPSRPPHLPSCPPPLSSTPSPLPCFASAFFRIVFCPADRDSIDTQSQGCQYLQIFTLMQRGSVEGEPWPASPCWLLTGTMPCSSCHDNRRPGCTSQTN